MLMSLDFTWFVELKDAQEHTLTTIRIVNIYDESTKVILTYQVTV